MNLKSLRTIVFAIAAALMAAAANAASVNVLQVEADYVSGAANAQYAAVNFAGAETKVYDGITFHALSTAGAPGTDPANSTYSGHADVVHYRLAAVDGPSNPITNVWSLTADDFLNNYVATSWSSTVASQPALIGNNVKIVNNSWVADYNNTNSDIDAVRRIDYMIRREDLVMVDGAVSPWGGSPNRLVWASRNGIAVRGTQTFTPSDATGIGKCHADLWGPKSGAADEAASYETPGIAGYAAGLIAEATTRGWANGVGTNGLRHEVVKSVLMTGADKTAAAFTTTGFTSWTSNGINNLDNANGAGRANYTTSLAVLDAGPKTMTTATNITLNAPLVTTDSAGWWYGSSLSANGSQALILDLTRLKLTGLTATLAWDVTQKTSGYNNNSLDTTADGTIFANLNLELLPVTRNGDTYSLGASLGIAGLVSKSTDDNIEHLYFGNTLARGYYALVASNMSDFSWAYGLSYNAALTLSTDATDLNTVLSYYNGPGDWTKGDLNGDGFIDATDLNTALSYYNGNGAVLAATMSARSMAVPEPCAAYMIVIALALLLGFYGKGQL